MIESLKQLLRNTVGKDYQDITEDTELRSDLGLSSYDLAQLACEVEDEYDIEIPNRSISKLITVGDVIDLIKDLQQG